jgi:hypothetical protein
MAINRRFPAWHYFNTSKETISLKEIVLDSVMSDLNFDICCEHFYGIMAEIPAFKLELIFLEEARNG